MKKLLFIAMIGATMSFAACSDSNEPDSPSQKTEITETEMTVSGTWKAGSEIKLDRHLVIPEGESLTIEPGVKIIVSTEGVGVNHTPIEIIVNGNLYVLGTEEQPVATSPMPTKATTIRIRAIIRLSMLTA